MAPDHPPTPPPSTGDGDPPTRTIDSARALRGLAHPLRVRLLEHLRHAGPATTTLLSEHLGEKPGTVSWHLRVLAEHGFIAEDEGRGTRRERWWRAVVGGTHLDADSYLAFRADPETRPLLGVVMQGFLGEQFARAAAVLADMENNVSDEELQRWAHATTNSDWQLRLTPDQLKALNDELASVVERHTPETPHPDAAPVAVQLQSYPRLLHKEEPA